MKLQTQIELCFWRLNYCPWRWKHENITTYVSRIKDLCDKLSAIGDKVSNFDMVTITLKGLIKNYHVVISSLGGRANLPTFN